MLVKGGSDVNGRGFKIVSSLETLEEEEEEEDGGGGGGDGGGGDDDDDDNDFCFDKGVDNYNANTMADDLWRLNVCCHHQQWCLDFDHAFWVMNGGNDDNVCFVWCL